MCKTLSFFLSLSPESSRFGWFTMIKHCFFYWAYFMSKSINSNSCNFFFLVTIYIYSLSALSLSVLLLLLSSFWTFCNRTWSPKSFFHLFCDVFFSCFSVSWKSAKVTWIGAVIIRETSRKVIINTRSDEHPQWPIAAIPFPPSPSLSYSCRQAKHWLYDQIISNISTKKKNENLRTVLAI